MRALVYAGEYLVDRRHGMDTRGIVRNESRLRDCSDGRDTNHYQAISARGFHEVVTAANVDPTSTTFIDLGAGRGRALLLAARLGFRSVVGIELDPELAAHAARNLRAWQRKRKSEAITSGRFEIRVDDAARADFPAEATLIFLYNSFGATTLRKVLDNITKSHSTARRMSLCYFNPVHADVFEEYPHFRMTASGRDWVVYTL